MAHGFVHKGGSLPPSSALKQGNTRQSLPSNLLEQEEKNWVWGSQEEGVLVDHSGSQPALPPLGLLVWASRLFEVSGYLCVGIYRPY